MILRVEDVAEKCCFAAALFRSQMVLRSLERSFKLTKNPDNSVMGRVLNGDESLTCCAIFSCLLFFLEDTCCEFCFRLGAMVLKECKTDGYKC